ncbi:MAG: cyclase family protein [Candidatus Margulisbacteria bacterium]|jgi:kynurenine formamidase|nr:cyclase family protein [Candidatus Margulisiibacteriota bacterium]
MKKLLVVLLLIIGSVFAAAPKDGLWGELDKWKKDYKWVDLSWEVSPQTPHWWGFDPLVVTPKYTFDGTFKDFGENENNSFSAFLYTLPGQYGTHTDFPGHFDRKGRKTNNYDVKDLVYPLVVIDKSAAVKKNFDYALTRQDILDFEAKHGKIPAGTFVVFRSDWSKRPLNNFEAVDTDNNAHYPGWSIEALQFLVKERNIAGIGHETPDTDPAAVGNSDAGMIGENYILNQGRLNVELLKNLDKLPPTGAIIFITYPNIKDGVGFTSRVFAVAPK